MTEDSAGDEDGPARQREGVDRRVLDDHVRERQVGTAAVGGERLAQIGDVLLQLRVAIDAHRLDHFLLRLLAHLDLLGLGDEIELQLSGGWVAHAGAEQEEKPGEIAHGPAR